MLRCRWSLFFSLSLNTFSSWLSIDSFVSSFFFYFLFHLHCSLVSMRIVSLIFHHFYTWFLFLLCILAFCAWENVQCFSRRNHERIRNLIENHSTFMVATFNHSRSFSDQSKKIKTPKNVSSHNTPNTTAMQLYKLYFKQNANNLIISKHISFKSMFSR